MYQYSFSPETVNPDLLSDQAIVNAQEPTILPESNLGVYYYNTNFFFSFSVTQLFQNAITFGNQDTDYSYGSRIYFGGGYKYNINEVLDISGSIYIKTYENKIFQLDINPKLIYESNYWIGFSLRTNNSIHYTAGVK